MNGFMFDNQFGTLAIAPISAAGNPAPLEDINWTNSNDAVVTMVVAENKLSAVVTAVGPVGTSQITVSADAKIGEGVVALEGIFNIEVKAGQAVQINFNFTPQDKPV